jgi:hypothetical protein
MQGQSCEATVRGTTHAQLGQLPLGVEDISSEEAMVMAHIIAQFNERLCTTTTIQGSVFVTT